MRQLRLPRGSPVDPAQHLAPRPSMGSVVRDWGLGAIATIQEHGTWNAYGVRVRMTLLWSGTLAMRRCIDDDNDNIFFSMRRTARAIRSPRLPASRSPPDRVAGSDLWAAARRAGTRPGPLATTRHDASCNCGCSSRGEPRAAQVMIDLRRGRGQRAYGCKPTSGICCVMRNSGSDDPRMRCPRRRSVMRSGK